MAYISEKEYLEIKDLCNHNLPTKTVVKHTGRGHATIARIRRSKDFEDYREITRKDGKDYLLKEQQENPDGMIHVGKLDMTPLERLIVSIDYIIADLSELRKALDDLTRKMDEKINHAAG